MHGREKCAFDHSCTLFSMLLMESSFNKCLSPDIDDAYQAGHQHEVIQWK